MVYWKQKSGMRVLTPLSFIGADMGKIIKRVAAVIVLALCAVFIWRCWLTADKSVFSKPIATENLREAWASGETEMLTVKRMEREISEDGYFKAYGLWIHPASGEVQLTVRWNDSVYRYTDMPDGWEYKFHLLNETTGEIYPAETVEKKERVMYHYRRLIVPGVEVAEGDQLTAVMELRDGFESKQVLKFDLQPLVNAKIPSSLVKALEASD